MANKRLGDNIEIGAITGSEYVPITDGTDDYKASPSQIADYTNNYLTIGGNSLQEQVSSNTISISALSIDVSTLEGLVSTNTTDITSIESELEIIAKDYVRFALNSGNLDASGNADLLAMTSATLKFKVDNGTTYKPLVQTYADGSSETNTSLTSITSLSTGGTYTVVREKAGNPIAVATPAYGKDLLVDFTQGNANDNYGLHAPIVIGSPTFTGNKFNSNGATGLGYPITTMGSGAWCVQGKFKSTNTTTRQQIFNGQKGIRSFEVCKTVNNKLSLYLSSNGSTEFYAVDNAGTKTDWSVSVEYYIRLRFTGTQYLVDWSTDYNPLTGTGTWTNDITVTNSAVVYPPVNGIFYGIFGNDSGTPLIGTMDDLQVTIGQSTCQRKKLVTQGKTFPTSPADGDYHCLTATGLQTYKRVSGAWVETQYNLLSPVNGITVAGSVISSVVQPVYNSKYSPNPNHTRPAVVVENYINGASWYRIWSDGWIEQGGYYTAVSQGDDYYINYLLSFSNTNYYFSRIPKIISLSGSNSAYNNGYTTKYNNRIRIATDNTAFTIGYDWFACGY